MEKSKAGVLRHQAYKLVKEKVINLELKPGDKVSEVELAKSLNESRTPVREALLMLEHEKLIVCDDSMGFLVRRLNKKDVEEYFAIRNVIEEFVIALVVKNITEEEIKGLRSNIEQGEIFIKEGDIRKIIRCETEFHEIMYRAARSDVLIETISPLIDKFQWFRGIALSVPGAATSSLSQHKRMLESLEIRDLKRLKRLMKAHLAEAKGRIECMPGLLL
jgi:DNA-binding GntR family transcriptional regulator